MARTGWILRGGLGRILENIGQTLEEEEDKDEEEEEEEEATP